MAYQANNLQYTTSQIFDYLQGLMPNTQRFIFINPYNDKTPPPPHYTDYAQFHILSEEDIGLNQQQISDYDKATDTVKVNYNQLKVITIQLDFYGPNALSNCNFYRQLLKVNLQLSKGQGILDLKTISNIRDLTFLQPNKQFCQRYNFDLEAYIIDTIQISSPYVDSVNISICNRGNGEE